MQVNEAITLLLQMMIYVTRDRTLTTLASRTTTYC